MSTRSQALRASMLLGTLAGALVGCEPSSPGKPSYPIEQIELCGATCVSGADSSNKVVKVIGDHHTYTWGVDELMPPGNDPYGSTHRLTWTPAFTNQELVAFDNDYAEPILQPPCPLCFEPYTWRFVALAGKGPGTTVSRTYSFQSPQDAWLGFTTGHLIRYDHGACRQRYLWQELLPRLVASLDHAVTCTLKCEKEFRPKFEKRLLVDVQPHFSSHHDVLRHGVLFDVLYSFDDNLVQASPAYAFSIDEASGGLRIEPIQLRVIAVNDDADSTQKKAISKALGEFFVRDTEPHVDQRLRNPAVIGTDVFLSCDGHAPLAKQQALCFSLATQVGPNGESPIFDAFHTRLASKYPEPTATNRALLAMSALTPRNFSCVEAANRCVVGVEALRVQATPSGLEAVFAETLGDDARIALDEAYGGHVFDEVCGIPALHKDGYVPRYTRTESENVWTTGAQCPPCP